MENYSFIPTLDQKKYEIINEWTTRVKKSVEVANKQSAPVLINHLPDILSNLCQLLGKGGHSEDDKKDKELGKDHGRQRAHLPGYCIEGVITEYMILSEVIIDCLYPVGSSKPSEEKIMHQYIDKMITSSVTEFVNIQKERMEKTLAELKEEKDTREKLISAISHDLRTPLTSIKLSTQILLKRPETLATHAPKIIKHVDRVDQMIQDLLDANLLKAGEMLPIQLSEFNLKNLIQETVQDLAATYGPRLKYQDSPDITGFWSHQALKRILENLISNAIKYGDTSAPVTIDSSTAKDKVVITVHNQGDPITEEEMESLFVPFKRTTSAKTSGKTGWGIGLGLVKGLVEAHRGQIRVKSLKELGTTFSIELPLDARGQTEKKKTLH